MHSPLHQFMIHPLIPLKIAGIDLSFTNASLFMLLAALLPTLLILSVRRSLRVIPGTIQAIIEMAYLFVANILRETNGDRGIVYFPLIFSVFVFLLFGNMLGMLPYSFTFTSQIAVTFGLAALLFCLITLVGVLRHGFKFFPFFYRRGFLGLWPLC